MFLTASVSLSVLSPQTCTLVQILSCHRYLEVSRDKELTPSVKEGVDTLLMYLYRALDNVHEMEKLVSSANSCVVVCFLISYLFFILFSFPSRATCFVTFFYNAEGFFSCSHPEVFYF